MTRKMYSLHLPCQNSAVIRTRSIKAIEDILKGGLAAIPEEPESPYSPYSPSPRPLKALSRKVSLTKRRVNSKLRRSGDGRGWQIRISKLTTVITASFFKLGESYVHTLSRLEDRGNLIGISMGPSASSMQN